jgi:hypothetical protein
VCESNVTLKIEKYIGRYSTAIRLIGRMHAEHIPELENQIEDCESRVVLDLEELQLVDVEAVRFLGTCETQGITLVNCSSYVREWVNKERD